MNKSFLLLVLPLILLACTSCPDGYLQTGTGCCLDSDDSGLCDVDEVVLQQEPSVTTDNELADEPSEELPLDDSPSPLVVEDPIHESETVQEDTVQEDVTMSIAEEYYALYEEKAQYVSYFVEDATYDRLWVFETDEIIKFIPTENYLEVDPSTRKVAKSKYSLGAALSSDQWEEVEIGKLLLVNYIVYDKKTYEWQGCLVNRGYYKLSNCIDARAAAGTYGFTPNEPLIVMIRRFAATDSPQALLKEFFGREPIKTQIGMTYKPSTSTQSILVDEVRFENNDGTHTKLLLHQGFGLPLKVDVLSGELHKNVASSVEFEWLVFNAAAFKSYDEAFIEK